MQRDVDLTFRDIHGSYEALLSNIHEIGDRALSRDRWTGTESSLRFLCVEQDVEMKDTDGRRPVVLRLAGPGENRNETNYVAVSYCWAVQPSKPTGRFGAEYLIRAENGQLRFPRCSQETFHRALRYARAHNVPFLWIDQECIDQDDPTDVERHIHCMHKVFAQSQHTIGLLSFPIRSAAQIDCLRVQLEQVTSPKGTTQEEASSHVQSLDISKICRVLKAIYRDPWFTRSWAFQEKLCSMGEGITLLLPQDPGFAKDRIFGNTPGEIELSLRELCLGPHYFNYQATSHDLEVQQALKEWIDLMKLFGGHRGMDLLVPQFEWHHSQYTFAANVVRQVELCSNSIVSDRLAIIANICRWKDRLNIRVLNSGKYSYSTCLLVLLLQNNELPTIAIDGQRNTPLRPILPMDVTIGELIDGVIRSEHPTSSMVPSAILDYAAKSLGLVEYRIDPASISFVVGTGWKANFVDSAFRIQSDDLSAAHKSSMKLKAQL